MRILFLHTDSFGGFGGIAKFNRDLLTAVCSCPEVSEVVALPRLLPEAPGDLPEKLTYVTRAAGGKLRFIRTAFQARASGPFDLVICGHINLLPVARLCKGVKSRLGLIIHGIDAWQPTRSRLANALVKNLDFFISVSDFTRQRFCGWSGILAEKGFILPNCIELEKFGVGPKRDDLVNRYKLNGKRVIMTLGRMSASERYKGFDEVLDVLPELVQEMPEIAYLVAGDGDDRPRLMQKAKDLGLAEQVVFAGRIPEAEKADHYRLADAFVMPGRGEGFGIVYLEALACGIPVVASVADASREAVRDGALGLLADPDDLSSVRQGIVQALAQPRGVRTGLDYFSFNSFRQRILQLMNDSTVQQFNKSTEPSHV